MQYMFNQFWILKYRRLDVTYKERLHFVVITCEIVDSKQVFNCCELWDVPLMGLTFRQLRKNFDTKEKRYNRYTVVLKVSIMKSHRIYKRYSRILHNICERITKSNFSSLFNVKNEFLTMCDQYAFG